MTHVIDQNVPRPDIPRFLSFFLERTTSDQQLVKQIPQFLFCKLLVQSLSFADLLVQSVWKDVKD